MLELLSRQAQQVFFRSLNSSNKRKNLFELKLSQALVLKFSTNHCNLSFLFFSPLRRNFPIFLRLFFALKTGLKQLLFFTLQ